MGRTVGRVAVTLLDTHVLLWLQAGSPRLGRRATAMAREAWARGEAAVAAITFWEIAMRRAKSQLDLDANLDFQAWRTSLLNSGLNEIALDGAIGIRAGQLPGLHGDPADRIIVATALDGHRLVTADRRILAWSGRLERIDARR